MLISLLHKKEPSPSRFIRSFSMPQIANQLTSRHILPESTTTTTNGIQWGWWWGNDKWSGNDNQCNHQLWVILTVALCNIYSTSKANKLYHNQLLHTYLNILCCCHLDIFAKFVFASFEKLHVLHLFCSMFCSQFKAICCVANFWHIDIQCHIV